MRVAVVGSGIAGLSAAWLLSARHEADIFESEGRLGGHAHTHELDIDGTTVRADTGFMVYNERTYPNLIRFFERLGVAHAESDMSFSVQCQEEDIEWSGTGIDSIFAQRGNVANPAFLRMIVDIVRFSNMADRLLADERVDSLTLGELLAREGFGHGFTDWYLIPMGSAIWSTPMGRMRDFPAKTFLRFADNHGLLHIAGKPKWRSVVGGARTYVEAVAAEVSGTTYLSSPVERVERAGDAVIVSWPGGSARYDAVVVATHAPQALALLGDPSPLELEVLGAFETSDSDVILHTDTSFLPSSPRALASWNYFSASAEASASTLSLTYFLNRLQPLGTEVPLLVTLNAHRDAHDSSVRARMDYAHPQFDRAAVAAQARLGEIQGTGGIWYAGAWQRYGFHEDGILSAVRVAESMGAPLPWGDELDETRTRALGGTS